MTKLYMIEEGQLNALRKVKKMLSNVAGLGAGEQRESAKILEVILRDPIEIPDKLDPPRKIADLMAKEADEGLLPVEEEQRQFSVTVDIQASFFFRDDACNMDFCREHADYQNPDETAFILFVGTDRLHSAACKETIAKMVDYGCSADFIRAYREAARDGAQRVLFYGG